MRITSHGSCLWHWGEATVWCLFQQLWTGWGPSLSSAVWFCGLWKPFVAKVTFDIYNDGPFGQFLNHYCEDSVPEDAFCDRFIMWIICSDYESEYHMSKQLMILVDFLLYSIWLSSSLLLWEGKVYHLTLMNFQLISKALKKREKKEVLFVFPVGWLAEFCEREHRQK